MHKLKIQLSQLNFTVGDLDGNCQKILAAHQLAVSKGADLVVFSELAITGYPPQDLLHKKYFLDEVSSKIEEIKKATKGSKTAILLGAPYAHSAKEPPYNSAFLIDDGEIVAISNKTCLPNYGIFDEYRYFRPAPVLGNFEFRGLRLAILVCEDIWHLKNAFLLNDKIFDCIISINASPFLMNKAEQRLFIVRRFLKDLKKPLVYVNQVGGQDAVLFDGGSFALDANSEMILQMKEFEEDNKIIELDGSSIELCDANSQNIKDQIGRIYHALVLGLRDYIYKNGFKKVILGMSGGIDSALVAAIAVDALGEENVKLVALPSRFNSQTSMDDALAAAKNLGVKLEVIEIENAIGAINEALKEQFAGTVKDTTEENIQSRVRGNILMALSNKFGHLLLSTGNKSELAVGYATIYGDMCGAFNPLKDVYKTQVFELAKWRNNNIPTISLYKKTNLIPQNIITKEPTAELRENQKDSDSLPEYELLDKILHQLIEERKSVLEITKSGFDEALVKKVAKLLFRSEYKRKQSVLGVKVSEMSFDSDRRYPITNQFKK
ncbi:MAG: synthetase [Rickettsiaceae bacterium]|jgi:NAD+ synthase|nr:synthetase [Rickettsiaceae bacterium]